MKTTFNNFRITVTIILCVAFTAMFAPMAIDKFGVVQGILLSLFWLAFIWGIYVLRAYLLSYKKQNE